MEIFDQPGKENTEVVMRVAAEAAFRLGIKKIVVASSKGTTAELALDLIEKHEIIVVTHCTGFPEENIQEMSEEMRKTLEDRGAKTVTAAHSFGTIGRAVRKKFGTYETDELIAGALRIFGQGTKVAIEVAMMACDRGFVNSGEEIIAIGGTEEGADTALILSAANSHNFFSLKVQEVLCKPRI